MGAVSALSLSSPQQLSRSALLSSPSCSPAARASPLRCQEEAADSGVQPSKAFIEFIQGVPEPVVPDVKLTRSVDGSTGVATFTFDNPSFLAASSQELGETTGMYLNDDEGVIKTNEVSLTLRSPHRHTLCLRGLL